MFLCIIVWCSLIFQWPLALSLLRCLFGIPRSSWSYLISYFTLPRAAGVEAGGPDLHLPVQHSGHNHHDQHPARHPSCAHGGHAARAQSRGGHTRAAPIARRSPRAQPAALVAHTQQAGALRSPRRRCARRALILVLQCISTSRSQI